MSRIITENYSYRLNSLINEFEFSPNSSSLIDFFLEEVQKDQNRKGSKNQKVFSANDLVRILEIKDSIELKRIFAYLNTIVKTFNGQYLHIHLNADLSEKLINNLITLAVWDALSEGLYDDSILDEQINSLKMITARPIEAPNNNGHSLNQIYRERYGLKHKLKFIEEIKNINFSAKKNGILLNLNKSNDCCVNLSEFSIFPESLNTYINLGESLQCIYDKNNTALQNITTILNLFPAERGQNIWSNSFISENINAWNQFPEYNFSKVITITSGEKTAENLLEMKKQNKFQAEEMYTIFSFEL